MKRFRRLLASAALGVGLMAPLPASAGFSIDGWLTGDDAARAIEVAQERGIPIALIYTSFETS
ncbi:MAG: hypothetical protein ACIAXF_07750 [Phycisphaerales bacterium JB063]